MVAASAITVSFRTLSLPPDCNRTINLEPVCNGDKGRLDDDEPVRSGVMAVVGLDGILSGDEILDNPVEDLCGNAVDGLPKGGSNTFLLIGEPDGDVHIDDVADCGVWAISCLRGRHLGPIGWWSVFE